MSQTKPQLVHTARQMLEARIAKYNNPAYLEWDWNDIPDKWERHAYSAFMDLQAAETRCTQLEAAAQQLIAEIGHFQNVIQYDGFTKLRALVNQQTEVSNGE